MADLPISVDPYEPTAAFAPAPAPAAVPAQLPYAPPAPAQLPNAPAPAQLPDAPAPAQLSDSPAVPAVADAEPTPDAIVEQSSETTTPQALPPPLPPPPPMDKSSMLLAEQLAEHAVKYVAHAYAFATLDTSSSLATEDERKEMLCNAVVRLFRAVCEVVKEEAPTQAAEGIDGVHRCRTMITSMQDKGKKEQICAHAKKVIQDAGGGENGAWQLYMYFRCQQTHGRVLGGAGAQNPPATVAAPSVPTFVTEAKATAGVPFDLSTAQMQCPANPIKPTKVAYPSHAGLSRGVVQHMMRNFAGRALNKEHIESGPAKNMVKIRPCFSAS